jgi:endoglucanase
MKSETDRIQSNNKKQIGKRLFRLAASVILCIIAASVLIWVWSANDPAGFNGALRVKNGKIVNRYGQPFVLQGVSTISLEKKGQYLDKKGFSELKSKWNVNCVRLDVKTYDYDGYCTRDDEFRAKMDSKIWWGVRCATECGMYVIIDWHVLNDRDPNRFIDYAVPFFSEMAAKYKNQNNVIFEICNEPNGDTSWADVKEYAEAVSGAIRSENNKSLIIVGTPEWCRRILEPVDDPVVDLNTAYSYHFYAASHGEENRKDLEDALNAGLPVVVSEFGITKYNGDERLAKDEGEKWLDLLDRYDVGRICYCLSNGKELTNLFRENCPKTNDWEDEDLTEYGMWIREQYNRRQWNPVL